jgi:hypothetical protein
MTGVALLILVAATSTWWFTHGRGWTNLDLFDEQGSEVRGPSIAGGEGVVFGVVEIPDTPELTLASVTPNELRADATATVEMLVCKGGHMGVGQASSMRGTCDEVVTAAGAVVDTDDQIVVLVRSAEPQVITMHGVRVKYSRGIRTGDEITGLTVVVTFD